MIRTIRTGIFIILLLALWQAVIYIGKWPDFLVPSPFGVYESLASGIADRSFITSTLSSMRRMLLGYGLSAVVGIPLGFIIGRIRLLDDTVGALILGLQTLPSVSWLPIAILWFGLSEWSVIFVVIMGAIVAITTSSMDGVKNIPPVHERAAKTMGAGGWKMYWYVLVPATLPSIITGLKLGWSFAWRSLMAGELLYISAGGLGFLLQSGRELNDMSRVLAVMVVILGIGMIVDRTAFSYAENWVRRRWGLAV